MAAHSEVEEAGRRAECVPSNPTFDGRGGEVRERGGRQFDKAVGAVEFEDVFLGGGGGSKRDWLRHDLRVAQQLAVMPVTGQVPGRAVVEVPQTNQTRLGAVQPPKPVLTDLHLAAFAGPEADFIHLTVEIGVSAAVAGILDEAAAQQVLQRGQRVGLPVYRRLIRGHQNSVQI